MGYQGLDFGTGLTNLGTSLAQGYKDRLELQHQFATEDLKRQQLAATMGYKQNYLSQRFGSNVVAVDPNLLGGTDPEDWGGHTGPNGEAYIPQHVADQLVKSQQIDTRVAGTKANTQTMANAISGRVATQVGQAQSAEQSANARALLSGGLRAIPTGMSAIIDPNTAAKTAAAQQQVDQARNLLLRGAGSPQPTFNLGAPAPIVPQASSDPAPSPLESQYMQKHAVDLPTARSVIQQYKQNQGQ